MEIELNCIPVLPKPTEKNQKALLAIAMELLGLSAETENEKDVLREDWDFIKQRER